MLLSASALAATSAQIASVPLGATQPVSGSPRLVVSYKKHGLASGRSRIFVRECRREFITRERKQARRNGFAVRFDRERGKGSHGTLYYGDCLTVL